MFFPKLSLTDSGRSLLVKALSGETLTFSKLAIGTGETNSAARTLTGMINQVVDMEITNIERGDGLVSLEGSFDNSVLNDNIYARELGVYAIDPDDGEILYAYANAGEFASYISASNSTSYERVSINVLVAVGDAEHIEAVMGEFTGYVTEKEFKEHTESTKNPHGVTADDVGLGNVPNVATNNQTPTFAGLTTSQANNPGTIPIENITSGETLRVMMGKIRNAIARLIHHLSASNPHNITAAKLGVGEIVRGTYTGSGVYGSGSKTSITFKSTPKLLIVMPVINSSHADYGGFIALNGVKILRAGGLSDDVVNSESQLHFTWGSTVSWYNSSNQYFQQNASGWQYTFLAIL